LIEKTSRDLGARYTPNQEVVYVYFSHISGLNSSRERRNLENLHHCHQLL